MGLHQQVVLLIPAAVQCIPLPSQSLIPATKISEFDMGVCSGFGVGIIRVNVLLTATWLCQIHAMQHTQNPKSN